MCLNSKLCEKPSVELAKYSLNCAVNFDPCISAKKCVFSKHIIAANNQPKLNIQ